MREEITKRIRTEDMKKIHSLIKNLENEPASSFNDDLIEILEEFLKEN